MMTHNAGPAPVQLVRGRGEDLSGKGDLIGLGTGALLDAEAVKVGNALEAFKSMEEVSDGSAPMREGGDVRRMGKE